MRVHVLFFGVLKDLVGKVSDSVDLDEGMSVSDVLSHSVLRYPRIKGSLDSIALAVNQEYAGPETILKDGDEVALLPPVSGGSGESEGEASASTGSGIRQSQGKVSNEPTEGLRNDSRDVFGYALIIRESIDTQRELESIKRGEDGAAVVFEGVVRNQTRGRKTLYLDYEAYEEMAQRQMENLAEQALKQFQVRDVRLVHRLGRLEIGETSVLIVVVSAHRAAAFDACRWLIDTLKRTVPIWKKEYFEDGAVWADGEPFPAEIRQGSSIARGSPGAEGASK
jgi:MoaE-MoaD fusion protein